MPENHLQDLIAEGEALETRALAALHALADRPLAARLGLAWRELGGACVSAAAALPASAIVVNRAIPSPGARPDPATIAGFYRERRIARHFLALPLHEAAEDGTDAFGAAGYRPARAWQKFARMADTPAARAAMPAGVEILRVTPDLPDMAEAAAGIAAAAFDLGALAVPWLSRLAEDPGWSVFAAVAEGRVVATGSFYRVGDAGWIDWDATAPDHRGRGLQRALLTARVAHARAEGIVRLHTCTGAEAPGDPQHSYHNILRSGFAETVRRENLCHQLSAEDSRSVAGNDHPPSPATVEQDLPRRAHGPEAST